MKCVSAICAVGAVFWLHSAPVLAQLVDLPYADYAEGAERLLSEIAVTQGLSAKEMVVAESVAGAWVYIGPCRGKTVEGDRELAAEALQLTAVFYPRRPLHAAILQMIAVMNIDGMGRGTDHACRFAFAKSGMKGPL